MQPLSEFSVKEFILRLKALIRESEVDTVLGAMAMKEGIFVLLFSHRFNKQYPVLILEAQDLAKTLQDVQNTVEENFAS